jgi:hypothetical protein
MFTIGTITTLAGFLQVWAVARWKRLNSLQKIAMVALFTPTIILALLLVFR